MLDPNGRLRLFARYGAGSQVFLHDIRVLLREAASQVPLAAATACKKKTRREAGFPSNSGVRDQAAAASSPFIFVIALFSI